MDDTELLIKEYILKEHPHIWIDFEGAKTTDLAKIPKLKQFYSLLRKSEMFDTTVFYITNIRREITTNSRKEENPSSDILASLYGGNFIGVNQALKVLNQPPLPIGLDALQNLWDHKARVFNPGTYYYVRRNLAGVDNWTSEMLLNKQYRMLFNSKQIGYEIQNQANQFLTEFDIEDYICNKKMVSTYSDGMLKKRIFYKKYEGTQTTLEDDFKMF
jgi:hypothetical protein